MSNNEVCMRLEGSMTINVDAETISLCRNVFKNVRNYSKNGQGWTTLVHTFACF